LCEAAGSARKRWRDAGDRPTCIPAPSTRLHRHLAGITADNMPDLRIHPRVSDIPAQGWDAAHDGNPFVAHAFLSGLEDTGCLRPDWGWTPHHVALRDGDRLVAAAPAYLKHNSHGEFVFDHAWAHAYAQHGQDYFPKLLCGVPYSPVTGP